MIAKKNARHEALQFNASDLLSGVRRQRMTAPRSHPPKTLTAQEGRLSLHLLGYRKTLDQARSNCHEKFCRETSNHVLRCTMEGQSTIGRSTVGNGDAAAGRGVISPLSIADLPTAGCPHAGFHSAMKWL
jgi:hypothetical protein